MRVPETPHLRYGGIGPAGCGDFGNQLPPIEDKELYDAAYALYNQVAAKLATVAEKLGYTRESLGQVVQEIPEKLEPPPTRVAGLRVYLEYLVSIEHTCDLTVKRVSHCSERKARKLLQDRGMIPEKTPEFTVLDVNSDADVDYLYQAILDTKNFRISIRKACEDAGSLSKALYCGMAFIISTEGLGLRKGYEDRPYDWVYLEAIERFKMHGYYMGLDKIAKHFDIKDERNGNTERTT